MRLIRICAGATALVVVVVATSTAQTPQPTDAQRKQAEAVKIDGAGIRVDGRLDEEAWLNAMPITDFVQKEPV